MRLLVLLAIAACAPAPPAVVAPVVARSRAEWDVDFIEPCEDIQAATALLRSLNASVADAGCGP